MNVETPTQYGCRTAEAVALMIALTLALVVGLTVGIAIGEEVRLTVDDK
jgi:predicted MFS family arabinose efflux permease